MKARKYNLRIGIYKVTSVADGYGGNTVSESYVGETWGMIKTVANTSRYAGRLTDLGITEPLDAIIVTMRHRNDITIDPTVYYLVYQGLKFVIQAITNKDLRNNEMEIIAVQKGTTTT